MRDDTTQSYILKLRDRAILALLVLGQVPAHAATDAARVVKYAQNDIVPVKAKLRFSTLIILPEKEEILDFTTGDKEFWIINGAHNLCYIHPAQAGIRSNLNLITASGHVYSFLLTEISSDPNAEPDLNFIEPKEQSGIGGSAFAQGYVAASEAEAYKREIQTIRDQANAQVQSAQANAQQQIQKFRSEYATKLQFEYHFESKGTGQPFLVSAIYHDDTFTYIKCAASEKPAIYEVKDGKPNLINFDLANGVYIVPKIVDSGYLAIGKKKLAFSRQAVTPSAHTAIPASERKENMTEPVTSPAAQPIQDKAPKPPGLMPKNIQAWVMLGLAVLMVIIMWLTGGKKSQTAPKSGTPSTQTSAPLEVNQAKIADLQNRIQELQREQQVALNQQNKFFGALQFENQTAAPAQITNPACRSHT